MRAVRVLFAFGGWIAALLLAINGTRRCERRGHTRAESHLAPARTSSSAQVPSVRPIRTFKFKGGLPFILQEEQLHIGVEVGVFEGRFSRWVLDQWHACTAYYMVDLWAPQSHYRQMDAAPLPEQLVRADAQTLSSARRADDPMLIFARARRRGVWTSHASRLHRMQPRPGCFGTHRLRLRRLSLTAPWILCT